jgi:hypothetical protein
LGKETVKTSNLVGKLKGLIEDGALFDGEVEPEALTVT